MPSTIIGLDAGIYEFEPEISSITTKDGITAFSFNVIGRYATLANLYIMDQSVANVPNQPNGSFKVVNRNLSHVSGGESGIYRLSISAEGGAENQSRIKETSYTYAQSDEQGKKFVGNNQIDVIYRLEWLYPSGTIITNSQSQSSANAETAAKSLISSLAVQVIYDRPEGVTSGRKIDQSKVTITGTSIESAGGLYRIRATASKGATPVYG